MNAVADTLAGVPPTQEGDQPADAPVQPLKAVAKAFDTLKLPRFSAAALALAGEPDCGATVKEAVALIGAFKDAYVAANEPQGKNYADTLVVRTELAAMGKPATKTADADGEAPDTEA
jgi:hypothetical protein